jgi:ferric-dicitrate binding protein FerR (iron transport regulator)
MVRHKKTIFTSLILLFILSSGAPCLLALEGTLTYFTGTVTVERGNEVHASRIGMSIRSGDIVRTGARSTAVITLEHNADIKLRADTVLDMAILGEEVKVRLLGGSIFSRIREKIFTSFGVEAETVLAGVRGTEFFIAYGRTIDSSSDIWLCVNEGKVNVVVQVTGERTVVREGEGINILGGSRLTEPRKYAWTRDLNWNTDPDRGSVEDQTDLDQAYHDLLDQDYD